MTRSNLRVLDGGRKTRIEHGTAGHFIAADRCCFRRHTSVGVCRVSTVGCYHPISRDAEPEEVGFRRLYETMVFVNDSDGQPVSWTEIDSDGYTTEDEAQAGHEAVVAKYEARARGES